MELEFSSSESLFRHRMTRHLPHEITTTYIGVRPAIFNALHFGGQLFQKKIVDTYITVERDHIQWIKANQ